MVPRRGLEPPRPQGTPAPEAGASTNSAIWAHGLGEMLAKTQDRRYDGPWSGCQSAG